MATKECGDFLADHDVLGGKKRWSRSAFYAFCDRIDVILGSEPAEARRLASIAVRLASRSKSNCAKARAWCALGACLRYVDRLYHAETCYQLALAEACPSLEPEILRRWSYVVLYSRRYQDARRLANRAVRAFARRGDTRGAGRSLLARALAREHSGDQQGAFEDYRAALRLIPHRDQFYHAAALQNLTFCLASENSTPTQLEEALDIIAETRKIVIKHQEYKLLKVRLRWAEVLVRLRLRRITPVKARASMERVVRILTGLKMPQDAAAAAADLATICARHCRSADVIEESIARLCDALETPEDLQQLFSDLRRAATVFDAAPAVSDAARSLRRACANYGVLAPIGLDDDDASDDDLDALQN